MLTRFAYVVIVLVFGLGSIVLCRLTQATFVESGSSWVAGPAQAAISYPVRLVGGLVESVQSMGDLRRENERLRAEIDQLRQATVALPELQRENQLLHEQLGMRRSLPNYQWTTARIIGYDPNPMVKAVVIDQGSRNGVDDGMTVMTPQGLVGRVIRVSPSNAKVLLITDVSSSVNGLVQASRARGVANGRTSDYLLMRYIGQSEVVRTGDKVITSGLGGLFPAGLAIGSVIDVRQKDVDMFQEARIEPAVDFDRLEIVLVITNFRPAKLE